MAMGTRPTACRVADVHACTSLQRMLGATHDVVNLCDRGVMF